MNKLIEQIDKLINKKGSLKTPAYYIRGLFIDIVNYFENKVNNLINSISNLKKSMNNELNVLKKDIDFNISLNEYLIEDDSMISVKGFPRVGNFTIDLRNNTTILIYDHSHKKTIFTSLRKEEHEIKLNNDYSDLEMFIIWYDYGYENTDLKSIIDALSFKDEITEITIYRKADFKNMYNDSIKQLTCVKSLCGSNIINSFNVSNFTNDNGHSLRIEGNFNIIDGSFNNNDYYTPDIKVNDIINSFNNNNSGFGIIDGILVGSIWDGMSYEISGSGTIAIINEGIRKLCENCLQRANSVIYHMLPNSLEILNAYACGKNVEILLHEGNKNLKIETKGYGNGLTPITYVGDTRILETFSLIDNDSNVNSANYSDINTYCIKNAKGEHITRVNITKLSNNYLFYYNKGQVRNSPTNVLFCIDHFHFDVPYIYYKNYYFSDKLRDLYVPNNLMAVRIIINSTNTINLSIGTAIENPLNEIIVPVGATGYDEADLNSKNWKITYVDSIEDYINEHHGD